MTVAGLVVGGLTVVLALAIDRANRARTPAVERDLDPEALTVALLASILRHPTRTYGRVAMGGVTVEAEWRKAVRMWRVQVDEHTGWVSDTTAVANLAGARLRAIAEERAEGRALRVGGAA